MQATFDEWTNRCNRRKARSRGLMLNTEIPPTFWNAGVAVPPTFWNTLR